jgi:hypothetical protein
MPMANARQSVFAGRPLASSRLDGASKVLLVAAGAMLLLLVLLAVFAPPVEDDPTPATWNVGSHGAKAALLLMQGLGYKARAWEQPLADLDRLSDAQAQQTTLVLAAPQTDPATADTTRATVHRFLVRGGTVLATGPSGAFLLGHTDLRPTSQFLGDLCLTTPDGQSPLARAGALQLAAPAAWGGDPDTGTLVAQRCGLGETSSAVVVQQHVGRGTATWWSAATPLSNQGLHRPASVRLLLASLAPFGQAQTAPTVVARTILFDESLHGDAGAGGPGPLQGLPLPLLWTQVGLVALLLVWSFSRRHGPVRPALVTARTSPLEFAQSMGALYSRGGATSAPLAAAELRLRRVLSTLAGVPRSALDSGPQAIVIALKSRHGEHMLWTAIGDHLQEAARAKEIDAEAAAPSRKRLQEALRLVRAMDSDTAAVAEQLKRAM